MQNAALNLLYIAVLCLTLTVASASAGEDVTVFPSRLQLTLDNNETVGQTVSFTFHPLCIRSFNVDVVASQPDAQVANLTGVLLNSCGGDTSTFKVEITGTGEPQEFELLFLDAEFGNQLAAIPVTVDSPSPGAEPLMGIRIGRNAIKFQVSSGGCTSKEDFRVEVLESYPLQLRLVRHRADPCDAYLPLGTRFKFKYRELGIERGTKLRVINPLATVTVPPPRQH